jgi:hypothetical protein
MVISKAGPVLEKTSFTTHHISHFHALPRTIYDGHVSVSQGTCPSMSQIRPFPPRSQSMASPHGSRTSQPSVFLRRPRDGMNRVPIVPPGLSLGAGTVPAGHLGVAPTTGTDKTGDHRNATPASFPGTLKKWKLQDMSFDFYSARKLPGILVITMATRISSSHKTSRHGMVLNMSISHRKLSQLPSQAMVFSFPVFL